MQVDIQSLRVANTYQYRIVDFDFERITDIVHIMQNSNQFAGDTVLTACDALGEEDWPEM
jgi:hypothetical protein